MGCELIRQLASKDRLILGHYNQSVAKLDQLRNTLPDLNLVPLQADFSQQEDVGRFIADISKQHGCPDKIVHLPAPKFEYLRFKDITWEAFQRNLDVQLRSIVCILGAFLPVMAQKKQGKVVVVLSSSTIGLPPGSLSHYVTTKYALLGLVRSLAVEYSAKRLNINAVSPSMVETAFLQNVPERLVEIAAGQSPWQRNATPRDVVGAIRFLLSADADYITGANLPISGGTAF